jgi:hypothetical protein
MPFVPWFALRTQGLMLGAIVPVATRSLLGVPDSWPLTAMSAEAYLNGKYRPDRDIPARSGFVRNRGASGI